MSSAEPPHFYRVCRFDFQNHLTINELLNMNLPSPISQVGPWRTYVTAETLIVRVNMVLFFIY